MRTILTALTALMFFATPVVAGDLEDTRAAYAAGDYQKAFPLWKPLAERGNPMAQFFLGLVYADGKGEPEDDAKAVHWYRKAAERGHARTPQNLGAAYALGRGVRRDYVQAHAWTSIAVAQGVDDAKGNKDKFRERMAPAQIAEAQKLSSEYWEKYVVPFQKD